MCKSAQFFGLSKNAVAQPGASGIAKIELLGRNCSPHDCPSTRWKASLHPGRGQQPNDSGLLGR